MARDSKKQRQKKICSKTKAEADNLKFTSYTKSKKKEKKK